MDPNNQREAADGSDLLKYLVIMGRDSFLKIWLKIAAWVATVKRLSLCTTDCTSLVVTPFMV